MTPRDSELATGLAMALLAGPWHQRAMTARMASSVGLTRAVPWISALTVDVLAAYPVAPAGRPRELADFLFGTPAWQQRGRQSPHVVRWRPGVVEPAPPRWQITALPDLGALACLLDVDQGELAWFADLRSLERHCDTPLRHYRWTELTRSGRAPRLVAAPKPRLKEIQRRLLRHVVAHIPLHDAAHGAVPSRSVRSATQPHAAAAVVIRMDLAGFFAAIPAGRVYGLLRVAGLTEAVAHTVTGLVTTVVPYAVSRDPYLGVPHLPQGAPSSPHLANAVSFRLDRRLAGLATRYGATYTRYVDDLVFSGGPSLRRARSAFVGAVDHIVVDEGFRVNERKTVVLGDSGRQAVLGTVVNAHPAVPRTERDRLRATLHNCVTRGWRSQAGDQSRDEFRSRLHGRIAWIGGIHPAHGLRLLAIAERIDWV